MSELRHVKGLSDLQKFLDQLPPKIERNVLRGALRAGARVIMAEAKRLVPVRMGDLRDSLRVTTRARGGKVTATVNAGGKTKRGADVFYAHMVEFGTRQHFIALPEEAMPMGRKGRRISIRTINRRAIKIGNQFISGAVHHPGARPRPFMRPALDNMAQAAVLTAAQYMRERLATKHQMLGAEMVVLRGDDE